MFLVLLTNKVQGWRESKRASVLPGQPTTSRERNKCVDFSQIRSDLTEFIVGMRSVLRDFSLLDGR